MKSTMYLGLSLSSLAFVFFGILTASASLGEDLKELDDMVTTLAGMVSNRTEKGIDVYYGNKDIDWGRVKEQNVSFGIVRSSYSSFFEDPKFVQNWQGMKNNGIEGSAYHFLKGTESAEEQVALIKRVLGKSDFDKTSDVIAVDVEREGNENASRDQMAETLHRTLEGLESAGFKNVYIYCGPNYWENGVAWRKYDFSKYNLWLSHYTTGSPTVPTTWREKGKTYTWWQYSESGQMDGVPGKVDMNSRKVNTDKFKRELFLATLNGSEGEYLKKYNLTLPS